MPIYQNLPNDKQNLGGIYTQGSPRDIIGPNSNLFNSESGEPFTPCCGDSGGPGGSGMNCAQILSTCDVASQINLSGLSLQLQKASGVVLDTVTLPNAVTNVINTGSVVTFNKVSGPADSIDVCAIVAANCAGGGSGGATQINVVGQNLELRDSANALLDTANICTLVTTACPVGATIDMTAGSNILNLRNGGGGLLDTAALPVTVVTSGAGGVYTVDNNASGVFTIDFNLTNTGSTLNLTGSAGVVTSSINICSLLSTCSVGASTNVTAGTNTLNLVNGAGTVIDTTALPVTTITNGAGGVYTVDNGAGSVTTVDFGLTNTGSTLNLTGSAGVVTSTIDICPLLSSCSVGASTTVTLGNTLNLLNGAGTIIDTTLLPVTTVTGPVSGGYYIINNGAGSSVNVTHSLSNTGTVLNLVGYIGQIESSIDLATILPAAAESPPKNRGTVTTVPSSVPGPATHHFFQVNTTSGNLNFTPVTNGELPTPITGAAKSDEFIFTNIGTGSFTFTSMEGFTYTFNQGDIMTIARIDATNKYRLT